MTFHAFPKFKFMQLLSLSNDIMIRYLPKHFFLHYIFKIIIINFANVWLSLNSIIPIIFCC